MYSRKLLKSNKNFNFKSNYIFKKYLNEVIDSHSNYRQTQFKPLPEKKPIRVSFLTALLLKNVNSEVFTYPEQISLRYNDFFKWIKPIEIYMSNCVHKKLDKNQILNELRKLEVFRTHISEEYFGLTLSNTESLKLIETLSILPWLGTYIVKNHISPLQIISKYGSKSQKMKYYPKIINGEMIPTVCVYEGDCGTNINNIQTFAIQDKENSWLLSGEKDYVVNGVDSNLFLVFAKNISPNIKMTGTDSFSLFLIERDFGNINCTNIYETIGRCEIPTCTINFNDTIVPNENIIGAPGDGFNILMEYLKPGHQNISAQAISILRNFINILIPDILQMRHYDRDLYQFDIVKKTLSEIIFSLYTMESMTYLTSGMIDEYEIIDADLEQILTETYCANKCLKCIQAGLQLVGAQSYMNNNSYLKAFHDAMALTTMDINNLDASTYAAGRIVQNIGHTMIDHVFKKKNVFQYPFYNMLDSLFERNSSKLNAEEYLHPSLAHAGRYMEDCIDRLKNSILILLERNGSKSLEQYIDLRRITEMLIEIYGAFANLSRSSRSYCIGAQHADLEKEVALKMTFVTHSKICEISKTIENGPTFNGDQCHISAMDILYEKRKYCMSHPLVKTF
ncbi:acyl-CoA dehydrogenase family member 9, mitochondrial-like [Apis mellifera]|uniref:Acyl-CoA dehydrogenase family member 9, mitochondrial-like n=1 Tax=Apis mellifera TaxID=7460 RepID=A0A7M7L0P2_APIME|nr:acyl-CoA dehydrogenase family member 9, mitochondrial-like [Apis mellifera]|eukprot:XP_026295913.1 acyl-CoA dehydrogenase family member 9, mitochondrial-like [Apis mellifera]